MQRINVPRFSLIVSILLLLLMISGLAYGQGIVTGSISGSVTDQTNAVVPGAKITAKNVETNQSLSTTSNDAGLFNLRAVPPGKYSMTIEAPKFRKVALSEITVSVARDTALAPVQLEVGSSTEVVEVSGAAPLVESTSVQIVASFDAQKVASLPINTNFDSLALYTPGVASVGSNDFSNTNGAGLSANGQRGRSNNFQLDGQSNNDNSIGGPSIFFGNQDALQEVQVVTNYTAEYGRNVGSVVNYITKSGTNQFHGSAFEYYQGSFTDSLDNTEKSPLFQGANGNPFCTPGQTPAANNCDDPVVPRRNRNRFGGTFGGPVIKNKAWFFGSAQWDRIRNGGTPKSSGSSLIPTPLGMQQLAAAFPGNSGVALLNAIGPYAVSAGNPVFAAMETQNVSDGTTTVPVEFGSVTRFITGLTNDFQATGRADIQFTEKDRFFARYIFQKTDQIAPPSVTDARFAAGAWIDLPAQDQQIGLDWTRTWSANFVNQARLSYSRAGFGFEGGSFSNCTRATITECPTNINLGGGFLSFGMQTNLPQGRLINVWQVQDNASWSHNRHTFKFGGEYAKQRSPNDFLPTINGSYTFPTFDRLIQNLPSSFSLTDGSPKIPFTEHDLAFYFQDDWRIKDNLTLNLGVRYEWFQNANNLLHDQTVARESDPAQAFWDTSLPLALRTVPEISEDRNNFSPVVGFAWTPRILPSIFGRDKTVIRGGFRISYDPAFYNMFLNTATSTPSVNLGTISAGVIPTLPSGGNYTGDDIRAQRLSAIPRGVNPGLRTQTTVSPNFHNPYTEGWSFGVQREITSKFVAEVRYVGNHSVGLFQSYNANPALNALINNGFASVIPAGLTPCSDPLAPGFGTGNVRGHVDCNRRNVLERGNTAFSIYHGVQSELRMSSWHGITANFGYTYSRNIDNSSEVFSTLTGGNTLTFSQSPFDSNRAERAVSGISFPHVFTAAFIYDVPFYKTQQGLLGKLLGGWQANLLHRYQSGQPYTVYQFKGLSGLTSLCDPSGTMSASFDACRPIELNAGAPFSSVGICTDGSLADCGMVDINTGDPVAPGSVHWLYNDQTALQFLGSNTPYVGAPRNIYRGETINNTSLSMFKTTKLNERISLRFEATAFNVFNRQFRGVPDPEIDDPGSFGNTTFNSSGGDSANAVEDGIARRRMQFGLKVIF
jgi:outer membrane receptor protein involved in Fe transport